MYYVLNDSGLNGFHGSNEASLFLVYFWSLSSHDLFISFLFSFSTSKKAKTSTDLINKKPTPFPVYALNLYFDQFDIYEVQSL